MDRCQLRMAAAAQNSGANTECGLFKTCVPFPNSSCHLEDGAWRVWLASTEKGHGQGALQEDRAHSLQTKAKGSTAP